MPKMEQEIRVIVRVSNAAHAEKIRLDIEEAVESRTPIYWISELVKPMVSIARMHGAAKINLPAEEGEQDVNP